ncbi:GAF domain-containing SpoIIE family protein phosphatase [Allostreptomyces psammosilenae]|uniref:GAF domain-containing protein n=1 Tax=Allostreptomyces psammosilenae TaxID=1892865 RepID=A0A852ZWJ6_9ACTN|nr:GAF domain-containing SpoIIE family protein phosphatase [Allostreptomyces psammosilenae]NYI06746.1 GAF domain-containing protein [Allostreptomyces psammosilenae]
MDVSDAVDGAVGTGFPRAPTAGRGAGAPDRRQALARTGLAARPDEAMDRFARMVRAHLGVDVGLVALVDGERQLFPGADGLPEPWGSARQSPLSHSFCQHVVASGQPLIIADTREHPLLRDSLAVVEMRVVGYAGMPLTDDDGRAIGSLCAVDHRPRRWTGAEVAALADLGAACSSELRLRLSRYDAEHARDASRAAWRVAERERGRAEDALEAARRANSELTWLGAVDAALADNRDPDDSARRLAGAVVPRLADCAFTVLVEEPGMVRVAGAAHRDPSRLIGLPVAARLPRQPSLAPLGRVLDSGRAVLVRHFAPLERARDPVEATWLRLCHWLGIGTALLLPLRVGGRGGAFGALVLLRERARRFGDADAALARVVAERASLAIDNARLFAAQANIAATLQRGMLTELPRPDGLELAAVYRPAERAAEVGGDWYDAFRLPGGTLALAVGDATGHDIQAATRMAHLRSSLRTLAVHAEHTPGLLLDWLDEAVDRLGAADHSTVLYAQLAPEPGPDAAGGYRLSWSNAGHPPPVLLAPDGRARLLWEGHAPLLGLAALSGGRRVDGRPTGRVALPPGSTLLCYTDALVESRTRPVDEGIARLLVGAERRHGLSLPRLCVELADELGDTRDDLTVLAVRVTR